MQIDTRKLKKLIIKAVPYVAFSYVGNLIGFAYRTAEGNGFQEKILPFMSNLGVAFARIFPSLHPFDLLFGLVLAGVMRLVLYVKSKNKKKFRQGEEYGSAVWGGEKDIEPYMDLSCPENNVILTKTESLTMGKPSAPKFARNKNILVIGGSGSGKTRFFVKPNLMQMHSSYVVTDPKGTVLVECGKMLERGRPKRVNGKVVYRRDDKGNYLKDKNGRYIPVYEPYKIKVFNTIDFAKSMHYNPFAYISKKNREKDILKFVEVLIKNTSSSQQPSGDDFWVKAEKLLYTALIAFIWYEGDEEEKNLNTLLDLLNESETREEDETYQNPVDMMFQELEERDPQHFAVRQYKKYKMAAGKTAKSILISCGARLAPFDIAELREIMSYDEMELDKIGDRKTALFLIMSDTDTTFNFVIAMLQSQLFNLLCDKADDEYGGRLPVHVRCLLDAASKMMDGKKLTEELGGGICQVSTTLYNAVLRAELNVTERSNHSMTVHYVPLSADAAISGTDKDLKFTNNLDHPVYIQGVAGGSSITFTIYGKEYRASNRKVEYVSETVSTRGPSEKVIKDNTMEEGKRVVESNGRTGYTARLWKVVYIDGKETKRTQVNSSSYMSTPSVVRVGTKKKEVPKPTTQKKDETAKAGEKAEGSKGTTGNNNQGANKAE